MKQFDWYADYLETILETNDQQLVAKTEKLEGILQNRIIDLHTEPNAREYQAAVEAIEGVRFLKAECLKAKV
jgi:hypothetical protein